MNLLQETIKAIKDSGHTPEQIIFIGSEESGHHCTWEEFQELADIEYGDGFDAQMVPLDLIIVFDGGATMWRSEFNGSEIWDYSRPFVFPSSLKPITRLAGPFCFYLEEINK